MFWFRDTVEGDVRVDVAFTDSSLDLRGREPGFLAERTRLEEACGVRFLSRVHQAHGADVLVVDDARPPEADDVPTADAVVTATRGVGLMVRAADCVPVLLVAPAAGVVGVAHAGRRGMELDIVGRTVEQVRALGADDLTAWVGPHICGACYEVPEEMRAEVASTVPASHATTSWGTPALDIGAGVHAQLEAAGVPAIDVGGCTREDPRLHSYRRDGATSGRMAGLVWMS